MDQLFFLRFSLFNSNARRHGGELASLPWTPLFGAHFSRADMLIITASPLRTGLPHVRMTSATDLSFLT